MTQKEAYLMNLFHFSLQQIQTLVQIGDIHMEDATIWGDKLVYQRFCQNAEPMLDDAGKPIVDDDEYLRLSVLTLIENIESFQAKAKKKNTQVSGIRDSIRGMRMHLPEHTSAGRPPQTMKEMFSFLECTKVALHFMAMNEWQEEVQEEDLPKPDIVITV